MEIYNVGDTIVSYDSHTKMVIAEVDEVNKFYVSRFKHGVPFNRAHLHSRGEFPQLLAEAPTMNAQRIAEVIMNDDVQMTEGQCMEFLNAVPPEEISAANALVE